MKVITADLEVGQRAITVLPSASDKDTHVFGMMPGDMPTVVWVGEAIHDPGLLEVELSWNVLDECDSIFMRVEPDRVWNVLPPIKPEAGI